jgi:hypothetical protein
VVVAAVAAVRVFHRRPSPESPESGRIPKTEHSLPPPKKNPKKIPIQKKSNPNLKKSLAKIMPLLRQKTAFFVLFHKHSPRRTLGFARFSISTPCGIPFIDIPQNRKNVKKFLQNTNNKR